MFDRVLTIEPSNPRVLKILDGINRRKKIRTIVTMLVAAGFVGGVSIMIHRQLEPPDEEAPPDPTQEGPETPPAHVEFVASDDPPPPDVDAAVALIVDAGVVAAVDAPQIAIAIDAATVVAPTMPVTITVSPWQGTHVIFGNDPPIDLGGETLTHVIPANGINVHVSHDGYMDQDVTVTADKTIYLQLLPARVIAACDDVSASVLIDKQSVKLGEEFLAPFKKNTTDREKIITVEFIGGHVDPSPITVKVRAGQVEKVSCVLR